MAIYIRTILGGGLALFSSRWLLNGLGETDWGLFAVVGGVIGFLAVINGAMSTSVQRYLSHSIGSGEVEQTIYYFNACFVMHAMGAGVIFLLGETLGVWFVDNVLTIPQERLFAAQIVFQCVLAVSIISVLSVPFAAFFIAKQRMVLISLLELVPVFLFFLLAYSIQSVSTDRLIFYAVAYAIISIIFVAVQVWIAFSFFPECRFYKKYLTDLTAVKEIASFSGWNLFGIIGSVCSRQGLAILLNMFFGPRMNASYGIAQQVNDQGGQLTMGIRKAFSPEITGREAKGEREGTISLALRSTKFATFISLFWMLPLAYEIDNILGIWLINVPQYTSEFCMLIFLIYLFDNVSTGYTMIVQAIGKIAGYQISMGILVMLTLPLAYILLVIFENPLVVPMASAGITFIQMWARVAWGRHLANVSPLRWIKEVVARIILAFIIPVVVLYVTQPMYASISTGYHVIITFSVSLLLSAMGVFFVGLTPKERVFVAEKVKGVFL